MSEILLRLDADLYTAGDTIFGAVYLRVDGPTSGYGIKVSIKGYESFYYHDIRRLKSPCKRLNDDCVSRESLLILDEQHILYMVRNPFAIGQYVFPFKQKLPDTLPGSFSQHSWHGPKWEAKVWYQVTAEVIGAEQVKVILPFQVNQHFVCDPAPEINVQRRVKAGRLIRGIKTNFGMVIRLDKGNYNIGETAKLRTLLHTTDALVKQMHIKLLRELQFSATQDKVPNHSACTHCNPKWDVTLVGEDREEQADEATSDDGTILRPEDGPAEVWNAFLSNEKSMYGRLVPTVFLLLSADHQDHTLQPTTHGRLIQCHYTIQIDIEMELGDKFVIKIPAPNISMADTNTASKTWDEKEWTKSCQVILPDLLVPCEQWTDWDVFNKHRFPTLCLLRSPASRRRISGRQRSVPLAAVISAGVCGDQEAL